MRMKKRHGPENKLRKMMGRRRMKAIAFGTGMREMQTAGGLWMIGGEIMKKKMMYR